MPDILLYLQLIRQNSTAINLTFCPAIENSTIYLSPVLFKITDYVIYLDHTFLGKDLAVIVTYLRDNKEPLSTILDGIFSYAKEKYPVRKDGLLLNLNSFWSECIKAEFKSVEDEFESIDSESSSPKPNSNSSSSKCSLVACQPGSHSPKSPLTPSPPQLSGAIPSATY